MRRALSGVLAAALAISMCATAASAASPRCRRHFVDADGDGVCDNAGRRCVYADADKDGVCDICGVEHGSCLARRGSAFVDADGDGVCDSCGSYHWCGRNFVDADGDGVCDRFPSGQGRGCRHGSDAQRGRGNSFRGGRGR